jgi:serpin B
MKKNLVLLLLVFFTIGCKEDSSVEPAKPVARLQIDIEPQEMIWAANGNDFAINLLAKACIEAAEKDAGKENIMLSPLSLQLALGMLSNGVTDDAFAEMASVMGFDDGSIESMNRYFHKLSAALMEEELDVELALANSIWVQNGFKVNDAFIQTNKDVYKAEVGNVNFADPATKDLINRWCNEHTRGTIKEIPLNLSSLTRMVLANTTYFKGDWTEPFEDTQKGVFTTAGGATQEVDMMMKKNSLLYTSNEKFQAVLLPYGNGSFSMTILLPSEESSVDELLGTIEWDKLPMNIYPVELSLPKFKARCHTDLIDLLETMGVRKIFENGALARIADNILINQVFQDMYLEVNETGTEASAVTAIGLLGAAGPPVMRVDRPFVFTLRENSTGVILFAGKIGKIEEE